MFNKYIRLVLFICLISLLAFKSQAQEPGNNLGKSYYQMYQEWGSNMLYLRNTEEGNEYLVHSNGIDMYFTFKNDRVVDELLLVASRNGFARQCYDNFRGTFVNESNYQRLEQYTNLVVLFYSYFKITIAYMETDSGEEQCWVQYSYK